MDTGLRKLEKGARSGAKEGLIDKGGGEEGETVRNDGE